MTSPLHLNACCAIGYSHPLTRLLLGDSLHPGGLPLTTRLAGLALITSSSTVLDAGTGLGATAVHLARTVGCRVTGITLEADGVAVAEEVAARQGVAGQVDFIRGDVQHIDLEQGHYDSVLMECVLSIFEDQDGAVGRMCGLLRPGGRLAISDVIVDGPLPPEFKGLIATAGCIGGALSLDGYASLLKRQGLVVEHAQDRPDVAGPFMAGLRDKMLAAELATKRGQLSIENGFLLEAQRLVSLAQELVSQGVLGYGILVARKPE